MGGCRWIDVGVRSIDLAVCPDGPCPTFLEVLVVWAPLSRSSESVIFRNPLLKPERERYPARGAQTAKTSRNVASGPSGQAGRSVERAPVSIFRYMPAAKRYAQRGLSRFPPSAVTKTPRITVFGHQPSPRVLKRGGEPIGQKIIRILKNSVQLLNYFSIPGRKGWEFLSLAGQVRRTRGGARA